MENTDKKVFEYKRDELIERIAYCRASRRCIKDIDMKMNSLRGYFLKNKSQIKMIESKMFAKNFKEQFPIQYGRFEVQLEILKDRKAEISHQGKSLKYEKEQLTKETNVEAELYKELALLESKMFLYLQNQSEEIKNQTISVNEHYICKVGLKWLRIAEFLFSPKTCNEIFYQTVGDWQNEYLEALRKGRIVDASYISVKYNFKVIYSIIVCSKIGKSVEFVMKIADVIEFFNKISK